VLRCMQHAQQRLCVVHGQLVLFSRCSTTNACL
jgi:hypothetical protein